MEWQAGYVCGALLIPVAHFRRVVSGYQQTNGIFGPVAAGSEHAAALIDKVRLAVPGFRRRRARPPLFTVSRKDRLTPERSVELRSAFVIGSMRTMQQDVEFGVLQIVDTALNPHSPDDTLISGAWPLAYSQQRSTDLRPNFSTPLCLRANSRASRFAIGRSRPLCPCSPKGGTSWT